ncbi:acetylornithine aminotransferase [Pseudomonas duriflava]|uniref:Acetylornithine aminotransferase n=1 Tax=Pseudomonas duriflava TaxID=459528 RepID=A0A562Q8J3_9PSED|nr:aspartate aminotransferase family protein [Pseudomonas duriflava]TWI52510.1 acetylornithine aminotransferase [Pseudomonas duriflava]
MSKTAFFDQAPSFSSSRLMKTYQPLPIRFVKGLGTRLWDQEEQEYLDAVAGVAVTNVGHSHPSVLEAITQQAGALLHVSNHYHNDWAEQLAYRLTKLTGMQQVFFGNSGAEANETALKLARLHAKRLGVDHPLIVVMERAFHGRTLGALSASDGLSIQAGFSPLLEGFVRIPFGDTIALETITSRYGERIVALLTEPIQGESGIHLPPPGYLKTLRRHCTSHGWLLMLDEIQTGLGRTGDWFAFQRESIVPDVLTLAKSLANGIPIGACLAIGEAAMLFSPGQHGSTFGGNPLACRVGCTVLDILERDALPAHANHQGQLLLTRLQEALREASHVRSIRGCGLMIGIELAQPCKHLMLEALEQHHLLINVTRDTTIRLLPPLVLDNNDLNILVDALRDLIV